MSIKAPAARIKKPVTQIKAPAALTFKSIIDFAAKGLAKSIVLNTYISPNMFLFLRRWRLIQLKQQRVSCKKH
jgi:hypothetical protein